MLVLTRKANESIAVDWKDRPELGTVTVQVVRIEGDRVRLGLDGPCDARFLRSELPCDARPSSNVADIFTRVARLLDAERAGQNERDQLLLADAAAHLRALAAEQP